MARDRSSREGASPRRLFVGVEIPEVARSVAWDAFAPVREAFPKAKWVPPENFHVTLKFLGPVWPRLVSWVEQGCASAAAVVEPFELSLSGAGRFPDSGKASTLWAGVADPERGTWKLAERLDAELGEEFPAERHPFSPHLTVARSRPPLDIDDVLGRVTLTAGPWVVSELLLIESHLGRPAPRYEPLARLPLGDA